MKKKLLSIALVIVGAMSVYGMDAKTPQKHFDFKINQSKGICTMTFTAYNYAGEALYSWTSMLSPIVDACLDKGLARLRELSN